MNITNYISSGYIEGYLFGMLTPDEVEQFEALLKQSPELRAEYDKVQQSMQGYLDAHAVKPPPMLQDKIWEKLQKEQQTVVSPVAKEEPAIEKYQEEKPAPKPYVPPAHPEVKEEPKPIEFEKPRPIKVPQPENEQTPYVRKYRLAPWFAAASFIGMLTASYLAYDYYNNWQEAEGKLTAYQSEKDQLAQQMEIQKANNKNLEKYNEMFRKPSMKFIKLDGKPISPQSGCMLCWDKETKDVIVTYANMPKAPAGKQYQLWGILDGKPINLGVIDMAAAEKGAAHMRSLAKAQAFAITLEQEGGSESPTLDQMYVFGNI